PTKTLARIECVFGTLNGAILMCARPITRSWSACVYVFLCVLTYYVAFHMRQRPALPRWRGKAPSPRSRSRPPRRPRRRASRRPTARPRTRAQPQTSAPRSTDRVYVPVGSAARTENESIPGKQRLAPCRGEKLGLEQDHLRRNRSRSCGGSWRIPAG